MTTQILTNKTTDGFGDEFNSVGSSTNHVNIEGTFDGAEVEVWAIRDHANSVFSFTGSKLTENNPYKRLDFVPETIYKLKVVGAGASTDLNAFAE